MKKFFMFALAAVSMASCTNDEFLGEGQGQGQNTTGAILFTAGGAQGPHKGVKRMAGELVGATAAQKLGGMFVVQGVKGTTAIGAGASATPVFDNYLALYEPNTAGTTESNTHNWEYDGKHTGKTGVMTAATWNALHNSTSYPGAAQDQSIKYWDYTTDEYNFIAWSTGGLEAVPTSTTLSASNAQVNRIANIPAGYAITVNSAANLNKVYYTDVNTVEHAHYGEPVVLTFKNMAAKIRVGLYETIPGYSVKDVKFYTAAPVYTAGVLTNATETKTSLYAASDVIAQSGTVTVTFPVTDEASKTTNATNHDRASIAVTPVADTKVSTLSWGDLVYEANAQKHEATANYLGRSANEATFGGVKADDYYMPVFPSQQGENLTLSVDYTLVSTDGSGEEIHVYAANAVVPSTYTKWQPNYAYTYIFKISDKTNGVTSKTESDPKGLFPITFDAVVAQQENAEQTTITTVATPSITTYQYKTDYKANEYEKKSDKIYAMVYDQSLTTPALVTLAGVSSLATADYASLYHISRAATEAEVMDALLKQASVNGSDITGRNGIVLTSNSNIAKVTTIEKGVDGNSVAVDGTNTKAAAIDASALTAGQYYAFVYVKTPETTGKKVYALASQAQVEAAAGKYYVVSAPTYDAGDAKAASSTAAEDKVYFAANLKADGVTFDSWTYMEKKVGDDVSGLFEVDLGSTMNTITYDSAKFYIDVYTDYAAVYGVKVIKMKD